MYACMHNVYHKHINIYIYIYTHIHIHINIQMCVYIYIYMLLVKENRYLATVRSASVTSVVLVVILTWNTIFISYFIGNYQYQCKNACIVMYAYAMCYQKLYL